MSDPTILQSSDPLSPAAQASEGVPEGTSTPQVGRPPRTRPGVVASPELRALTADGSATDIAEAPVSTEPPVGGLVAEGVVAEHWHEPGNGPVLTPAGAHRHTPDGPVHIHLAEPVSTTAGYVRPAPWDDRLNPAPSGYDASATWRVDVDHRAVIDHQVIELKAGERVSGRLGLHLAETGAPVSRIPDPE